MKKFLVWTGFCFIAAVVVAILSIQDQVYTGNDVIATVSSQHHMVIDTSQPITMEVASNAFFLFRKSSGDTVAGVISQQPLGWNQGDYYHAGPTQITGGTWIVQDGTNITVHVTSANIFAMRVVPDKKMADFLLILISGAIIWLTGPLLYGLATRLVPK